MKSREELLTIVAEIRQELADLAVLKKAVGQAQGKIQTNTNALNKVSLRGALRPCSG
jgi:ribosomal protein L29